MRTVFIALITAILAGGCVSGQPAQVATLSVALGGDGEVRTIEQITELQTVSGFTEYGDGTRVDQHKSVRLGVWGTATRVGNAVAFQLTERRLAEMKQRDGIDLPLVATDTFAQIYPIAAARAGIAVFDGRYTIIVRE